MGTKREAWAAFVAASALMTAQAQAVSDADKCEAAKNKIAGKYAFGLQKDNAKAIKKGTAVDHAKTNATFAEKTAPG